MWERPQTNVPNTDKSQGVRTASLPIYSFGEVAKANEALWSIVSDRLHERGVDMAQVRFDSLRQAVPEEIGSEVFLT